ncbi:hypothetical protein Q2T76_02570 [Lactobacillus sp. YT155]|uniref:PTS sugar transporter subunit IIA n=1 Tax=Lactobacillus sp. YT155 TaxID=3060955 RepID=UPI00265ECBCD|nr:hypothetical protein [Lactobacillus sp. YT155]MDO1604936.1 hypothetical protein [Lactobacillus sp. YT155]
MNYIVCSHGDYAKASIESCEMITGELKNFYAYSFDGDKNIENVSKDFLEIIRNNHLKFEETIFLTDLKSGTPNNAAVYIANQYAIAGIYTGTSLSDLVFIAMGENVDSVFELKAENTGKINLLNLSEEEEEEEE